MTLSLLMSGLNIIRKPESILMKIMIFSYFYFLTNEIDSLILPTLQKLIIWLTCDYIDQQISNLIAYRNFR